ncbi:MAG: pyridoxamine 5'-phosphate oxidase family protein [Synergistaceae bacterium]|nr:pyridoxamine 5'-phosphate oxidase family protein [Synergistaceae bacterium]
MRRKDREVTDFNTIVSIIDECDVIRIGLADGNFPYIVPLNFAYTVREQETCFYIHGAMAGKKYEMLKNCPYCSFEMDIPFSIDCIPEMKAVTMRYKSVMGKCKVDFLEGNEKQSAMDNIFMARYEKTKNFDYDKNMLEKTAVAKLTVIELTAKANPMQE